MHSNSRQSDNHVVIALITTEILDLSSPKYVERKKTDIKAGFTEAQMNEKSAKLAALGVPDITIKRNSPRTAFPLSPGCLAA